MSGGKWNNLIQAVESLVFNNLSAANGHSGSNAGQAAIGEYTVKCPVTVALCSVTLTPSSSLTANQPSGGSYAEQSTLGVWATTVTEDATGSHRTTKAPVTFSNCPAFTWNDVALNDCYFGGLSLGKTVNSGDTVLLNTGTLTISEA